MKKVLSILLSVMMVAGLFVALIPAASAATKTDLTAAVAPPSYTLGEAWYTEDFENVNASLTGANLFSALGWDAGNKALPSGTTFAVETEGENQWVSLIGSAKVVPFLTDERLAGGDYYLGTYKTYNTISASKTSYINAENKGVSQFPCDMVTIEVVA